MMLNYWERETGGIRQEIGTFGGSFREILWPLCHWHGDPERNNWIQDKDVQLRKLHNEEYYSHNIGNIIQSEKLRRARLIARMEREGAFKKMAGKLKERSL